MSKYKKLLDVFKTYNKVMIPFSLLGTGFGINDTLNMRPKTDVKSHCKYVFTNYTLTFYLYPVSFLYIYYMTEDSKDGSKTGFI